MEKNTKEIEPGIFIHGMVVSSTAKKIERKDGSGSAVLVTHEISLRPGLAKWVQFYDQHDQQVQITQDKVTKYPKLEELKPISLKVSSIKAEKGQIEIKSAEIVA